MERLSNKQLIKKFEKDCELRDCSPWTIQSYYSNLNIFSGFLETYNLSMLDLDRDILREYIAYEKENGHRKKTIGNRFSTISSFCDYAVYEKLMEKNIVNDVRKRYLNPYKDNYNDNMRKFINIKECSYFVNSILDLRDKTIVVLFHKTGPRRRELVAIDVDDICWRNYSIQLKPTHKRSNLTVFFDYECALLLKKWLKKRELMVDEDNPALFPSYIDKKKRLNRNGVGEIFKKWAILAGLYEPNSNRIEDKYTPHCARHWFTTHLRRAGMPREYIKWLRGDKLSEAMDIYNRIDPEDVRKSYLSCIPKLGIC
ncbi:MAG: tyrosine-type recombinase/integrase [Candidatus Thermoplasmatota archaeon]|nr:tyrosine-type recombinase/integrase [Candidatus Thermoplasmatota archaeon]